VIRDWVVLLAASLAILDVTACTPAVDKNALAAVQVSGSPETPRTCRLLGPVEARDDNRWVPGGPTLETAMLHLREKAVLGGGNYLQIDAIAPPHDSDYNPAYVVHARLFSCTGVVAPVPSGEAAKAKAPPVLIGNAPIPGATVAARTAPPPPVPPSADSPPSAASCEPDCSPGFTCLRGACVSACNPRCGAGERCGADRVCHPIAAVAAPSAVPP
jgi:hypothetical protein